MSESTNALSVSQGGVVQFLAPGSGYDSGLALVRHHSFEAVEEDGDVSPGGRRAVTEVFSFGRGDFGELMLGEQEQVKKPELVEKLSDKQIVATSCAAFSSAAVTATGMLLLSGSNEEGVLDSSCEAPRIDVPRSLEQLATQRVVSVSCGDAHTAVITATQTVLTFGSDEYHQCAQGEHEEGAPMFGVRPRAVRGLGRSRAAQVACGSNFTVILTSNGQVFTAGNGVQGALGHGDGNTRSEATLVETLDGIAVAQVSAGSSHVVAVTETGLAYAWGRNRFGQTGLSVSKWGSVVYEPRRVRSLPELAQQVSCGGEHSVFVAQSGTAYACGCRAEGALGIGDAEAEEVVDVPRRVVGVGAPDRPVREVAAGRAHTLFLLRDGDVFACGRNKEGQLGIAREIEHVHTPLRVPLLSSCGVFTLSAGGDHSLALRVARGSVLSTPPGSMPIGVMAFLGTDTLTRLANEAKRTASFDVIRRIVNELFSQPSNLSGSFLLGPNPDEPSFVHVRGKGAISGRQLLERALEALRATSGQAQLMDARTPTFSSSSVLRLASISIEDLDAEAKQFNHEDLATSSATKPVPEEDGAKYFETEAATAGSSPKQSESEEGSRLSIRAPSVEVEKVDNTVFPGVGGAIVSGIEGVVADVRTIVPPDAPPSAGWSASTEKPASAAAAEEDVIEEEEVEEEQQQGALALRWPPPEEVFFGPASKIGDGRAFPAPPMVARRLQTSGVDVDGLEKTYVALLRTYSTALVQDLGDAILQAARTVATRAASWTEPDQLRVFLVLLLCPLLARKSRQAHETMALLASAIAKLPKASRELLMAWIGTDMNGPVFRARVLAAVLTHIDSSLELVASRRGSSFVASGINAMKALADLLKLAKSLYDLNETLAVRNREWALYGAAAADAEAGSGAIPTTPAPPKKSTSASTPSKSTTSKAPPSNATTGEKDDMVDAGRKVAAAVAAAEDDEGRSGREDAEKHEDEEDEDGPGMTVLGEGGSAHLAHPVPSTADLHEYAAAALSDRGTAVQTDSKSGALGAALGDDLFAHRTWGLVPPSAFYSELASNMPPEVLQRDYEAWRQVTELRRRGRQGLEAFLTLCDYPIVLDAAAKRRVLSYEAALSQQTMSLSAIFRASSLGATPFFIIQVRRDHLLTDAINAIASSAPWELKKPLRVVFRDEEAVDAGGVTKEFFQLLVEQVFDPDFGMFRVEPTTRQYWIRVGAGGVVGEIDDTEETLGEKRKQLSEFRLVGVILALAIYNGVLLDVHLPQAMYKKLLGETKLGLADLLEVDPELGRGLVGLLQSEDDVESTFCLAFEAAYDLFGEHKTAPLIPDGPDKPVTNDNAAEYVRAYAQWLLTTSIRPQFDQLLAGFGLVLDGPGLSLFRPEELELLIAGTPRFDFRELERVATYDGGFTAEHPTVRRFWNVVHALPWDLQKKLLLFVTGSARAPIGGLAKLPFKIQRNSDDQSRLPSASTCFNILLLPDYQTEEVLDERLRTAISETRGFGLQ